MKNQRNTYLFTLLALLGAAVAGGCSKDEIEPYAADASSVYFTTNNVEHSFLDTPDAESCDIEVPVSILGPAVDYDRAIAYEIDPELTTAPDDKYEITSAVVEAGALSGAIRVRIYNDAALEDARYTVAFRMLSNEFFENRVSDVSMTAQKLMFYQTASLTWDDQITRPEWLLYRNTMRYITYTALYADEEGNIYGQQAADGSRTMLSSKYVSNGVYSKTFYRIIREIWPAKINNYGYYGTDAETTAQYPLFYPGATYFSVLIHQLQQYVYEYNQTHDEPLCHSDDAAILNSTGSVVTVSSASLGKSFTLSNIKECPILVNPYNQ